MVIAREAGAEGEGLPCLLSALMKGSCLPKRPAHSSVRCDSTLQGDKHRQESQTDTPPRGPAARSADSPPRALLPCGWCGEARARDCTAAAAAAAAQGARRARLPLRQHLIVELDARRPGKR